MFSTRAGRLAWLGHWLYEPKVAGSSPARPTIQLFKQRDLLNPLKYLTPLSKIGSLGLSIGLESKKLDLVFKRCFWALLSQISSLIQEGQPLACLFTAHCFCGAYFCGSPSRIQASKRPQ
jgi:hypothetical protein